MYTLQRSTNEYQSHVDDGEERFIFNEDGVLAPIWGSTYERGLGYASTSWQTSMKSEWNKMYFIMSFSIVYLGNMGYSFEFMYSVCEKYKGTYFPKFYIYYLSIKEYINLQQAFIPHIAVR